LKKYAEPSEAKMVDSGLASEIAHGSLSLTE